MHLGFVLVPLIRDAHILNKAHQQPELAVDNLYDKDSERNCTTIHSAFDQY